MSKAPSGGYLPIELEALLLKSSLLEASAVEASSVRETTDKMVTNSTKRCRDQTRIFERPHSCFVDGVSSIICKRYWVRGNDG